MLLKRAVWMTLIAYSLILAAVCLSPMGGDPALVPSKTRRIINNMLHVPAFAVHAWLCILAVRPVLTRGIGRRALATGAFMALLYGLVLEIGQGYVPGRVTSMGDMILNSIGILAAVVITWALPRSRQPARTESIEDVPD